jgi:hypothetical protein
MRSRPRRPAGILLRPLDREAMATDAPAQTHCPTCGAKLHRHDLSLCAYCGSPLALGGARPAVDDETVKRLVRMRESPNYSSAMAFTPLDAEIAESAARIRMIGGLNLIVVIGFAAFALWQYGGSAWSSVAMIVAYVALAVMLLLMFGVPAMLESKARGISMLRRPALVVSRRSEMIDKGKYGTTLYYFTLRFDDGSEGEFRWRGRGTMYEPMSNGATGMAYTSGERLIDFRKL